MLRSSKQQQQQSRGPSNESTGISMLRDQQSSSSNGSGGGKGAATNGNHGGHNTNRKFWGEEVTDDAIYNVYLKKITYSCHDNSVYDHLPFEKLTTKGGNSNGNNTSDGHNRSHNDSSSTNNGSGNNNDGSGGGAVGSGSLVDGLQRAFFSKDVFRRKSLDKGSSSNKNKRSASTSDMLDYGRVNGSLINGSGNNQRSPNHHRQQQFLPDSSATSISSSSSQNTSPSLKDVDSSLKEENGIKMKNYQKILTETFSSRSSPTKLAHRTATGTELTLSSTSSESSTSSSDPTQSLQWETRQIRILKAATLEHIVQYILHLTRRQQEQELKESSGSTSHCQSVVMEEERNNVSHVMHVLFIAYRTFSNPRELFQSLHQYSSQTCTSHQQFNFVLIYWLNHYPEDFLIPTTNLNNGSNNSNSKSSRSKSSSNILHQAIEPQSLPLTSSSSTSNGTESPPTKPDRELKSLPSPISHHKRSEFSSRRSSSGLNRDRSCSSSRRSSSSSNHGPKLIDQLISLPNLDQMIVRKAMVILESSKSNPLFNDMDVTFDNSASPAYAMNGAPAKASSSNILELDARFVAQQLTAIDLEHFLSLKPYSLLEGTRANPLVQSTIKNFNLLSRHVIVTILKANSPEIVTSHWIEISLNLRRMKNFNSLKAVIAGLTNESIYRLKSVVWSKLSRSTLSNFKILSSIVDDVNNQSVLRQTQLDMEGTAKVSLSEESFGTIPYLGTFFTDLTMIDSMYSTFIESKKSGKKLINIEKCSKQFEVITQVQLLQKNIRAALSAHNQSQSSNHLHLNGVSSSPSISSLISSPSSTNNAVIVPRVARLFRNWFNDSSISSLTENDCYKLSQLVEPPTPKK